MVRTTLIGLLITGVTPIALADATVLSNRQLVPFATQSLSTKITLPAFCNSPLVCPQITDIKQPKVKYAPLQTITNIFLSGSVLPQCIEQFPTNFKSDKTTAKPLSTILKSSKNISAFDGCILPWQLGVEPKTTYNQQTITSSKLVTNNSDSLQPSQAPSIATPLNKFPKLSRSSLITPFPQEDSTFVPGTSKFANPAPETKHIASPFGWRIRPYSSQLQFHEGIDYSAPLGSPVVAVANGIVTKVVSGCIDFGNIYCGGQLGNWIEIDHGQGAIAIYGHLKNSSIKVEEGMTVWKNQEIAQVGSSGWSTGAHLDFRVKVNGQKIDPVKFLVSN